MVASASRAFALALCLGVAACASGGSTMGGDELSPAMVRAAAVSGDAAMAQNEFRMAAGLYEKSYRADPDAAVAVRWGRALRMAGDPQAAVLALQDASRKFPSDAPLLTELGRSAMAGNYESEAADALGRAAALPGAGWETFMTAGAQRARAGNPAEAEAFFRRGEAVATTDRQRLSAQANLALLRSMGGDLRGAIADLEAVTARPGADPKVNANLAMLYGAAGDRTGMAAQAGRAGFTAADTQAMGRWLGAEPEVVAEEPRPRPRRVRRAAPAAAPAAE